MLVARMFRLAWHVGQEISNVKEPCHACVLPRTPHMCSEA